jgi:endoglucanase
MGKYIIKKVTFLLTVAILLSVFSITDSFAISQLIQNNDFNYGRSDPWKLVTVDNGKASYEVSNGKLNVTILKPGQNRWDIQLVQRGLKLIEGHSYTVAFTVSSTKNCKVYPSVRDQGDSYEEYWNYNNTSWQSINLVANTPVTVIETFKMTKPTQTAIEMSFHLGGDLCTSDVPYTVSFDDIYISDPAGGDCYPEEPPEQTNEIRVNQVGYYCSLNKLATLVSDSTEPVDWALINDSGKVVYQGETTVKGFDKSSGDKVHIIDFSGYRTAGKDYKLVSDNFESMPFDIGNNLYEDLKHQSIKYFYLNRSGIKIEMPYSESYELLRTALDPEDVIRPENTNGYVGNYILDVTGGWQNDENNGKSPVNSGVATWTLLNQYERALNYEDIKVFPYGDNTMNIPEGGNYIPDILDEASYNLKALLKMQVPEGNTLSGMVHHEISNIYKRGVTGEYIDHRVLQPPSTAATLNLAAIAAQGSRLWKEYNLNFANKCLDAAKTAWDAAIENPSILAPTANSFGYGDNYFDDEFYWAACELYITTGEEKYLEYIQNSKHYLEVPTKLTGGTDVDTTGCFNWCNTAGMGTISLALARNNLPEADKATAKANIIKAADKFISIAESQGYGVPIEECTLEAELQGFPIYSNFYVITEAIVMAYANDFSSNYKYINGMAGAMDYLLGRNPMVQSYITGYGDNPVENPFHRIWSYQADHLAPKPPAGCLSSGPNSGLQDNWVKGSGWTPGSRAPEKCFMDRIESWSTNDLELNLNAPLAWVSAYIDENVIKLPPPPPPFLFGDVNEDNNIDALDLAAIKKYLLTQSDFSINTKRADVNGDGSVDAIDYALIKQYLLKIIGYFPVEAK